MYSKKMFKKYPKVYQTPDVFPATYGPLVQWNAEPSSDNRPGLGYSILELQFKAIKALL
jgi:hypothetical protein